MGTHHRPRRAHLLRRFLQREGGTSRTLLLASAEERELLEIDGLSAGSAAAGPAAQEGLKEQHRLRQVTVSVDAVGERGTLPLGWSLYLPEEWCDDPERRRKAKIPGDNVVVTAVPL